MDRNTTTTHNDIKVWSKGDVSDCPFASITAPVTTTPSSHHGRNAQVRVVITRKKPPSGPKPIEPPITNITPTLPQKSPFIKHSGSPDGPLTVALGHTTHSRASAGNSASKQPRDPSGPQPHSDVDPMSGTSRRVHKAIKVEDTGGTPLSMRRRIESQPRFFRASSHPPIPRPMFRPPRHRLFPREDKDRSVGDILEHKEVGEAEQQGYETDEEKRILNAAIEERDRAIKTYRVMRKKAFKQKLHDIKNATKLYRDKLAGLRFTSELGNFELH